MTLERWFLIFAIIVAIILHLTLIPARSNPMWSLPGLIGAGVILFFADFIGLFFAQIIPSQKWPLAIRIFGWVMLMYDPILFVINRIFDPIIKFLYS
ncbi:MAG: hypothetical protein K8R90_02250 [Candidatus Cloacimonetes bacterium]|nr:hypothetical protein [Candidatus Cloacimonadota bacterium]